MSQDSLKPGLGICSFALLKRVTRAIWVDRSFHFFEHKSDFVLRVGFAPFWRENWKLDIYHAFWLCSGFGIRSFALRVFTLLKRAKEQFALFWEEKKTIRTKETKSEFSTLPNLVTVSLYLLLLWLDPGAVPLRDVLDPGDGDVHQHQPHPHSSQLIHEHPHLRIQGETSPPVVISQILIAVNSSMNKLIYAFKVRQALQ